MKVMMMTTMTTMKMKIIHSIQNFFVIFLLLSLSTVRMTTGTESPAAVRRLQSTEPCTVCANGAPVTIKDRLVAVPDIPDYLSCAQLDQLVPMFFPDKSSQECKMIQATGSLCGCPKTGDCQFCSSSKLEFPDRELTFLASSFGGIAPTCEMLEAYLHSQNATDTICLVSKNFMSEYCGCQTEAITTVGLDGLDLGGSGTPCGLCGVDSYVPELDKPLNITGFPFNTCGELETAVATLLVEDSETCSVLQSLGSLCDCPLQEDPCTLCKDEGPITKPDKTLNFLKDQFMGMEPSCNIFEAYARSLPKNSDECINVQHSGGLCGCKPAENHCDPCPGYPREKLDLDRVLPAKFSNFLGLNDLDFTFTCELAMAFADVTPADHKTCQIIQDGSFLCNCHDGQFDYANADTLQKKIILVWTARVSAFISLLGVLLIVVHVLKEKSRRQNIYSQIMLSMSSYDIAYSVAWMFAAAPMDTADLFPFWGEYGNQQTCRAQGFFIQLGLTSIYYNASLGMYYYLVICRRFSERKLKKLRIFLHILPITVGLIFAFVGIPYFRPYGVFCHLPPPPFADQKWPGLWLFLIPGCFATLCATISTLFVYFKVRSLSKASRKWRFESLQMFVGAQTDTVKDDTTSVRSSAKRRLSAKTIAVVAAKKRQKNRIDNEVLVQAVLYLSALSVCWVVHCVGYIKLSRGDNISYGFHVLQTLFGPLQGFFNTVVYFRPKIVRHRRQVARKRRLQQKEEQKQEDQPPRDLRIAGDDGNQNHYARDSDSKSFDACHFQSRSLFLSNAEDMEEIVVVLEEGPESFNSRPQRVCRKKDAKELQGTDGSDTATTGSTEKHVAVPDCSSRLTAEEDERDEDGCGSLYDPEIFIEDPSMYIARNNVDEELGDN